MHLLPKIFPRDLHQREEDAERSLIRLEGKIGGSLFGPVQKGHNREFFCLDEHSWVWHESWLEKGQPKSLTIRYEVRPNGVLKSQDGRTYQRLSADEARNLYQAAKLYRYHVGTEYQRLTQQAA